MTGSVRSDNHSKRDGNGNACDCSDDARVIEFVVPSYERMRDLESRVQEIVREGDMCAERARAGTDGCNNDEIFLIVTAVVILVAMCIGAYMHKSYWSFTAVIALIMAILIIIGVLTKSSCLMLCVLICAIILVVANIIHLIMLIMNARAESSISADERVCLIRISSMSGPNGYDGLPKDEENNGNQCSDEGPSGFNIIDFVVPSHERMRDIENGIQEIVGDGVTEARARAGGDGCANDEIFLIVVAVLIFIQTVIGAVMERNYFSAAPVVSLIMAILIIIGVLMKSGCVMLCVLICAIILVIIYIVQLIFVLVHGTGGGGSLIVVVLVLILVIICTCCVCFAANNLRGTYG